MTKEEMADAVELECQKANAIWQNDWEWGWKMEELSAACGITVAGPTLANGKKDKEHEHRTRFTKHLRKVIRRDDYDLNEVALHKLELVDAILTFKG